MTKMLHRLLHLACFAILVSTLSANTPFTLTIERGEKEGNYTFSGSINQSGTCWWKLTKPIPAGTYHGAATSMDSSGKPGIFLYEFAPKKDPTGDRPYQGSLNHLFVGIFVHAGKNQYHSDGCIVIEKADFEKIFADISPQDTPNVTIVVKDK